MILVTGGTGYIGSHACVALAQAGHELLIVDNLANSRADVVDRLGGICGRRPAFVEGDCRDAALLDDVFDRYPVSAVMHFAGLKAVGESVAKPLEYYDNNINGTLQLLAAMRRAAVRTLIFSSSATVYGDPAAANASTSGVTITRRRMAPAYATTFMWSIWPRAMSPRSTRSIGRAAC